MNRLIIIGNGFDLAHGLNTKYEHFIDWYWKQLAIKAATDHTNELSDCLCSIKIMDSNKSWHLLNFENSFHLSQVEGDEFRSFILKNKDYFSFKPSSFFENIQKSIEINKWVDIENEYYSLLKKYIKNPESCNYTADELNNQLAYLQDKLIEYLGSIPIDEGICNCRILDRIYSPINPKDVSVESRERLIKYVINLLPDDSYNNLCEKLCYYNIIGSIHSSDMDKLRKSYDYEGIENVLYSIQKGFCNDILLPDNIMLLSFNYTKTARLYRKKDEHFSINYIHGKLDEKKSIIFGYGDELDEEYKQLQNQNINEYLKNIKSIRYLESENYRNVLSFIESAPYQVCIMGHSCGNSDRTLLNTLFEHKNCISVKPYYYKKDDGTDNYLEIAQNISRNFTDMKLMRDRVVNKKYCETLTD